jgi:arsenate reductase
MVVHLAAMLPSPRASRPLVLAYAGCGTCKKALKWLGEHSVEIDVRPIVDAPPTAEELSAWVPKSGRPLRKWLNTSGLSYRALGKERLDAAKDEEILRWLTQDGKLVKRPILVHGQRVLVGFDEKAYREAFGG